MADVLTPEQRRKNMSGIRATDTKPELMLRRRIHAAGYRYRLHVRSLPGTPDIVFTRRKCVIFVNGCFWHSHSCRFGLVKPVTNAAFWEEKRRRTVVRDAVKRDELEALGWSVLNIWECELRDLARLDDSIVQFLGTAGSVTADRSR
ncbi:very short patch repair endonuclease [Cryobacterium arcticum]|uniref:Very short patch repair endonuclease n=1 Tax=Cryobacterium arcticum TaxID=670052 RepID=A0A317ZT49_9MICO|nr:very short patch repair endonuclease [Cryobacterium arcticum]PXA68299.1 very short patch repair endonuclease [Cryobacterium arcticum]